MGTVDIEGHISGSLTADEGDQCRHRGEVMGPGMGMDPGVDLQGGRRVHPGGEDAGVPVRGHFEELRRPLVRVLLGDGGVPGLDEGVDFLPDLRRGGQQLVRTGGGEVGGDLLVEERHEIRIRGVDLAQHRIDRLETGQVQVEVALLLLLQPGQFPEALVRVDGRGEVAVPVPGARAEAGEDHVHVLVFLGEDGLPHRVVGPPDTLAPDGDVVVGRAHGVEVLRVQLGGECPLDL